MTNRTAARRYARALLDVCLKETDPQQVEQELVAFAGLVGAHAELARVLANPAVPSPRKRAAVAEILVRAPVSPVLGRLLLLLAERDRLVLLPDLATAFRERLLDHRRVVRAAVTTAVPLPDDRVQALRQGLAAATGREVVLEASVDPAIVGGVVARVGSLVFDGSVTRQLERMREKLAQE
ncbi:MAG TPA: ATP synthase F1 subunit delta [Candidatus Limnocylindrales bacterium]|nr:ATP synthase F1 subunit delta [Candidatus Limnocylindrales bacterium]